jgi:hypothetical protein
MKIKSGVGAQIDKADHQDKKRNNEYFKEYYMEGNQSKHPDVNCFNEKEGDLCWVVFQSAKNVYNSGYPIIANQGHHNFVAECKHAFLSINNWAWKEIKALQDYESKQRSKEEKM